MSVLLGDGIEGYGILLDDVVIFVPLVGGPVSADIEVRVTYSITAVCFHASLDTTYLRLPSCMMARRPLLDGRISWRNRRYF
jgi:hypothetical protein